MMESDIEDYNGEHLSDIIDVFTERKLFENTITENITSTETLTGYKLIKNNLSITNNAIVTLGNSAVLAIDGDLTINSGSTLSILNNTSLFWYNNNKIIINGTMTIGASNTALFNRSANIVINSGGQLIIDGTLEVGENSNLIISGGGFVKLNGNINAKPGASISINQSTKLLEVNKKINFDTDFNSIIIKNGKIVMKNTYAELYIYSGVDNVIIDNVKVTSLNGTSNNGHDGIDIRSNGNITIKNSTFEYGHSGLSTSRASSSPIIYVDDCNFRYCYYGFKAYGSGVGIDGCTFEYNTYRGLYFYNMYKQSYINNCTIKYQNGSYDYGLYYYGTSYARLSMYGNNIYNNYYGAYINGNFTTSIKCGSISNNTEYGVYAYNTDIYLANASGISGGSNALYSNKYGIKINGGYASLHLNNGYNDLRSDTYCVTGTLDYMPGGNIVCSNNYWKNGGGAPVYMSNYNLTGQGMPIYLSDYSPNSSFSPCYNPGPMSMSMGSEPFAETYDYRTVNTSLGKMPLNDAVNQILNTNKELGEVYDINTQYELLSEVLTNNFTKLNKGEEWYVKHTYNMFKSEMGKFENDANTNRVSTHLMNKMLNVIRKLQKDFDKEDKKISKYSVYKASLVADEADMLWFNGDYDAAIILLKKLYKKVDKEQQYEITRTICRINVDRAFVESNNTLEIDELLEVCEECNESKKSGTINNGEDDIENGSDIVPNKNMGIDEYSLTIIPNPVSQSSVIKVFGYKGAQMAVYNSAGQVVFNEQLQSNNYSKTVSNTNLDKGIYMVVVTVNGKPVQSQKMVVVK